MPGQKTYKVTLAEDERAWLRKMLASGKAAARKLNHARVLLYTDQDVEGLRRTDQQIADTLGVSLRMVARVRQRFVEEGIAAALQPRPRPHGAYRLDEQAAAHIISRWQRESHLKDANAGLCGSSRIDWSCWDTVRFPTRRYDRC